MHKFGLHLHDVLFGAGGVAAALAALDAAPEVVAGTVADTVAGILGDLAKGGLSYTGGATYNSVTLSPSSGVDLTTGPDFGTGLSLTGAPSFTFGDGRSDPGQQTQTDCVAYLVELDDLVDDDPGIAALLPKQECPLDAAAKACKLEEPLTDSSPLVQALAKH